MNYHFVCPECAREYPLSEIRYRCDCGVPLDLAREGAPPPVSRDLFDGRLGTRRGPGAGGVWRFRELLPPYPAAGIVSKPEGNTNLYAVGADETTGLRRLGEYAGLGALWLKHEGENPTGSFKDRGMTVGVTQAAALQVRAVACASTGNTSASLAAYAALAGLPCFVFVPAGKISAGKLAQTLAYGAITVQVRGDFDAAMRLVAEVCAALGIYLVNSINPFRLEGQKTIAWDLLQQMEWNAPDWLVLPAGNLGNTSAIGRALLEARDLGLITRVPRIAAVQASGASPFYQSYQTGFVQRFRVQADTIASAIKIGDPVSYERARAVIRATEGIVTAVDDAALLDAKALIDRAGIGCEPASATTLAGLRQLVMAGTIAPDARVAAILTGHLLKDPDTTGAYHLHTDPAPPHANRPLVVDADVAAVEAELARYL